MVFYRFQVKLSLDIFRDGAALISGKKLPLTTVITFFELDQVSVDCVCWPKTKSAAHSEVKQVIQACAFATRGVVLPAHRTNR